MLSAMTLGWFWFQFFAGPVEKVETRQGYKLVWRQAECEYVNRAQDPPKVVQVSGTLTVEVHPPPRPPALLRCTIHLRR